MREGELLGLKWEDVDFERKKVQVRRTISRIPHQGFQVAEPKTQKSQRNIHLTNLALESLLRHRVRQSEARLSAGPLWNEQGWIFCNAVGNPIEVTNMIKLSFRPLLVKAGVPQITFHCLRHSTASLLLSLGIHPEIVQELLGHSQITLTLDTYSHVLPSLQGEALDRLGALLTTADGPVAVKVAVKADEVQGA